MSVLSDLKKHHLEEDNARLRDALHTIAVIATADIDASATIAAISATMTAINLHQAFCDIARIARNALVSAAPENRALRHPHEHHEGDQA